MQAPPSTDAASAAPGGVDDLLGGLDHLSVGPAPSSSTAAAGPQDDVFSLSALDSVPVPAAGAAALAGLPKLVDGAAAQGCDIHGRLRRSGTGEFEYCFGFLNNTAVPLTGFHIQVRQAQRHTRMHTHTPRNMVCPQKQTGPIGLGVAAAALVTRRCPFLSAPGFYYVGSRDESLAMQPICCNCAIPVVCGAAVWPEHEGRPRLRQRGQTRTIARACLCLVGGIISPPQCGCPSLKRRGSGCSLRRMI